MGVVHRDRAREVVLSRAVAPKMIRPDARPTERDLAQFRAAARERLEGLAKEEAELIRLFGKTSELNRHLQPRREIRAGIEKAARHNEEVFEKATRQVFQTLYHEAFHAYVGNFVFPTGKNELPRWLNEGLAQVFETAVFEAGELRLGHADRLRLEKAVTDPFNLARFLEAQSDCYETALGELKAGSKTTHWMWFIFPQIAGL